MNLYTYTFTFNICINIYIYTCVRVKLCQLMMASQPSEILGLYIYICKQAFCWRTHGKKQHPNSRLQGPTTPDSTQVHIITVMKTGRQAAISTVFAESLPLWLNSREALVPGLDFQSKQVTKWGHFVNKKHCRL